MSEPMSIPAVYMVDGYMVDGCVIDLQQVAAVICCNESGTHVCRVILRSGVSFNVDMQYSRSLIQAVEWSRSPGSVVRQKDGFVDQGERVDNSWTN